MKTLTLSQSGIALSALGYGCMNIGGAWNAATWTAADRAQAERAVQTALEHGITLFDHADIYGRGKSEAIFGQILKAQPHLRDQIVLQSKCGIRLADEPTPGMPPRYDFSYDHIVASVEASLDRLQTDRLDILLLHRPDPLMEPTEVARAFDHLHTHGKVRAFGVSNHTPGQIELLRRAVDQPLEINQIELSLLHVGALSAGVDANRRGLEYTAADGVLEYCRLNAILVQAWSPLAGGRLSAPAETASVVERATAGLISALASAKACSVEAVQLAWLMRYPGPVQPIIGTTNPQRIAACAEADQLTLTREEWYQLFNAARGVNIP